MPTAGANTEDYIYVLKIGSNLLDASIEQSIPYRRSSFTAHIPISRSIEDTDYTPQLNSYGASKMGFLKITALKVLPINLAAEILKAAIVKAYLKIDSPTSTYKAIQIWDTDNTRLELAIGTIGGKK